MLFHAKEFAFVTYMANILIVCTIAIEVEVVKNSQLSGSQNSIVVVWQRCNHATYQRRKVVACRLACV